MKKIIIKENDSGQRLDKFLKKYFINASLGLIYKLNRKNKVKVNGKRQDNEYKLQIGNEIRIYLSDKEIETLTEKKELNLPKDKTNFLRKDIVYEDSEVLVVNKNYGISVHPGDFKTKELSLIQEVHDYLGDKLNSLTFKPSLVHRIDKDTSGIIIIAKTKPTLDSLLKQLQTNKIKKEYIAITKKVEGKAKGTINKKLYRIKDAKNKNKIEINESKGQKAITHFEVIGETKKGNYNIVKCSLETGRMHQIRIHLASEGIPIIGDKPYGDKKENIEALKNYGINRHLLHASKIIFTHPKTKKTITLEARLKNDMQSLL